jgi:hypothetical protein
MSTIGVLNLIFSTDTASLTKGTSKARSEVKSVAVAVEQAGSRMKGLLAGAAAALGVGSLGAWVKGSMDAINSTRVLAEQLGTSTEALSKLQYAAKLADVDSGTLATSLTKMEKSLAEVAETGGGTAAGALQRLSLSAGDLVREDPAEAFHAIVNALGEVQNPAERMKAALDIFGKGAAGILNLSVQGKEGLSALLEEADALGVSFSDVDAAKIDEADDAMTRVWESVAGVGRSLAVELAPWITETASLFTEWMKSGVDASSFVSQSIDWVVNAFGFFADAIQVGEAAWNGFIAIFAEGISYLLAGVQKIVEGFSWVKEKLTGSGLNIGNTLTEWSTAFEQVATEKLDRAGEVWGKEWAHNTVRSFADELKSGAGDRALQSVEASKKFRGTPAIDKVEGKGKGADHDSKAIDKVDGKGADHDSKAMEFGSSEAANTILRTRFGAGGKDLSAVADNTKRTAEGVDRIAAALNAQGDDTAFEVLESLD